MSKIMDGLFNSDAKVEEAEEEKTPTNEEPEAKGAEDETAQEQGDEKAEGKEEAAGGRKVKVKVDGEEMEYDLSNEDTPSVIQKGLAFDRVQQQRDKYKADVEASQAALDFLGALAKQNGMSVSEYVKAGIENHNERLKTAERAALLAKYPDADDALIDELVNARLKEKAVDKTKAEESEKLREQEQKMRRFLSRFPDVKDLASLPEAVKKAIAAGEDPVIAMLEHRLREKDAAIAAIEKERQDKQINEKNKEQSTGSTASKDAAVAPGNIFERALFGG